MPEHPHQEEVMSAPAPRVRAEPEALAPAVRVTDIHMPFWSMAGFMVKWALASIPAIFLFFGVGFIAYLVFQTALYSYAMHSANPYLLHH